MQKKHKGRAGAVLDIIEQMGEATPKEIFQLMEDKHRPKHFHMMSGTLHNLWTAGAVLRAKIPAEGGGRATYRYRINPNPAPPVIERKLKEPTDAGYKATIEELKAKISELRAWQADAVKRYPQLAVDENVLKARKIVAERIRASDPRGAEAILAGERDATVAVQAVVDALESV